MKSDSDKNKTITSINSADSDSDMNKTLTDVNSPDPANNTTVDDEDDVMVSESTGDAPYDAKRQRLMVLLPLLGLVGIIAILIIVFGLKFGLWACSSREYHYEATGDIDVEISDSQDYYVAFDKELVAGRDDDDTYILFLGDDILTYGETSIAEQVADNTGATVYNCGFSGSSYARDAEKLSLDTCDDVFSFISIATCIMTGDYTMLDYYKTYANIYEAEEFDKSLDTLEHIDFNDIDIIFLCYGTNDYLRGHNTKNIYNPSSQEATTGALTLGMEAIHTKYPHIRFVVVSPTYGFYTSEDGTKISGDLYYTGIPSDEQSPDNLETWGRSYESLAGYVSAINDIAIRDNVTYLDCYYDNILHAENSDKYMDDAIHVTDEVREYMANKLSDYIKFRLYFT